MGGQSWQIGRVYGIPLRVHISWFLVFALVTWSLARHYFPAVLSHRLPWQYWSLGVVAALLLFASVLVHELGHCLVALRYRVPIAQITLFIFGGMAQIKREAPTPKAEFLIAIAGPIVSIMLGLGFWVLAELPGAPPALVALSEHLRNINLVLAIFNLVPGYPLDGGRVLRAGLWAWSKNFHKATRYSARVGQGFAVLLMLFGVYDVVAGLAIGGVWFLLIGAFLYTAAHSTHRQVSFQESLTGLCVGDVMTTDVVALEAGLTLDEAVNNYFLRFGFGGFPVVNEGRLVGMLSLKELKAIPRERWSALTVGEAMVPHGYQTEIHPDEPITAAMERMFHDDRGRLVVMEDGKVLGLVTRSGIARFLDLRQR
ncbi:MAG: site-2 protease family protein [Desulfomonile tiedjei]|nr:site-2 protease family protein [Desulfomonile tiedjei]